MGVWIAVVVAVLLLGVLTASYVFSGIVLHSRRQPIVRTPHDYDMPYEDVAFESTDGLSIHGWFIPAGSRTDRVIVLTHPMPMNRHGFLAKNQGFPPLFKTDVDLLKMVRALHEAGYPVLAFDLRNHGESDAGVTGNGLSEYQDVLGAIRYVRCRPDLDVQQVGLVCFCMGAASAMAALSKGPNETTSVRFLVAIQPVTSKVFFRCYLRDVYTPLSLFLIPVVEKLVQWRGGYALDDMAPGQFAPDITVPTLYVQAEQDPWTETSDVQGFYDATPGPKDLWWIPGKMRRFDAYNYVGEHPERVLAFVSGHFE